ncbi:tripartite tricarboxylate transporter substrate binding protein [Rhodococcus koreensis]|uniref:tripartite tricarboxylate transporter substrate binding protein n=1 Tax=Rhodococcus koreensis TaxID=99653 RepID=UPI00366A6134
MDLKRSIPWLAIAAVTVSGCAKAQMPAADYPSGTVRIVSPFAAGSLSDTAARVAAECLEQDLDATFVVENRDGGGGAIGMTEVARAEPNGRVLAVATVGAAALVPQVTQGAEYTGASFAPIYGLTLYNSVLVVAGNSPYQDIHAFLDAAKKSDRDFSVAMAGAKGAQSLTMNSITKAGGPRFANVPFASPDEVTASVLGGGADSAFMSLSPGVIKRVDRGELRILATGSEQPIASMPGVPTFDAVGFPDLPTSDASVMLLGPTGLPQEIQDVLAKSMGTCMQSEKATTALGEYVRKDQAGPESMRNELTTSEAQWREAIGQ